MSAPPARSSLFPTGALAPSLFKSYLGAFYDYVYALLGTDGSAALARESLNVALPNYLDNPDGAIYQRSEVLTNDDTYADDRWYVLTQTTTIIPGRINSPENGYRYGLRMQQPQIAAQRMGRAQIVPGFRTQELRGQTVTFGGRFQFSSSANIRVAILAWTGAEDVVTSDVVASWTSGTYTTGNFFNSTTLSVVGTASQALTAGVPATVSVSGAVPSGATNLILLYWTEAAAAQSATLDAWGLRLVQASSLVDYIRRSMQEERVRCQEYQRLCPSALSGQAITTTAADVNVIFGVEMRATPTVLTLAGSSTLTGSFPLRVAGSTSTIAGTWSVVTNDRRAMNLQFTRSSGTWTAGNSVYLNDSTAPLLFDANL